MTACLYLNNAVGIYLGTHVVVTHGGFGQGAKGINNGYGLCSILETPELLANRGKHSLEHFILQLFPSILSTHNTRFKGFKFLGNESFTVGKGLLTDIILGHKLLKRVGYLNVITKHPIKTYSEVFNTRSFLFAGFNFRYHSGTVFYYVDKLVKLLIKALTEHTALTNDCGRLIHNGRAHKSANIVHNVQAVVKANQQLGICTAQGSLDIRQTLTGVGYGVKILGVSRLVHNAGKQALKVTDTVHILHKLATHNCVIHQLLGGVKALVNIQKA